MYCPEPHLRKLVLNTGVRQRGVKRLKAIIYGTFSKKFAYIVINEFNFVEKERKFLQSTSKISQWEPFASLAADVLLL